MARMLGRYRSRGCCPGAREGRPGPDCSRGHRIGTRRAKRKETRAELWALAEELEMLADWPAGETIALSRK